MLNQDLLAKAANNDVEAMVELAIAYYNCEDGEENRYKAFELYQRVLQLDPTNARAINNLGNCYNNGIGVEEDISKAKEYYRKSAELGNANAQYNLADSLKKEGNSECLTWYQKAFENGDADAPYEMALIYKDGEIVQKDNAKAAEYLSNAVDMGNISATLDLACAYLRGDIVEQDKVKGVELMRRAADAGNGTAANNLSILYEKGDGVEADINASIDWAVKAAENGDGDQAFEYALAFFNGKAPFEEDKAKGLEFFILSANAGSVVAMENVGVCYNNAYGTERNTEKAIEWFEKAARVGSEKGFNNLKELYNEVYGETGKERYIQILTEVADDGYYIAMVRLHDCYIEGDGVSQDISKAISYLDTAVEGGFSTACFAKGLYFFNGEYGHEKNMAEGVRLWTIAANKGHVTATFNLGICYRDGDGVEKNLVEAASWFEKAADEGYTNAMLNLADMYFEGNGVPADTEKALALLQKAADNNNTAALFRLGLRYYHGDYGIIQDREKAVEYWRIGSEAGDSGCTKNLGLCYKNGEGVPQDFSLAIEYFEKAMAQGSIDAMLELGYAYDANGITTPDYEKAANYYAEAYAAGSAHGAFCLGTMYEAGNGVPKDESKALDLYTYASEHGHARATVKVGIFIHDGLGTEKDVAKSVEYFEKAKAMGDPEADSMLAFVYTRNTTEDGTDPKKAFDFNLKRANEGDAEAQYMIYQAYENGEGVQEDSQIATEWLRKAADNGHTIAQALMGFNEIIKGNTAAGIEYWEKASAGGHLKATHDLAELYLDGDNGVPVNKTRAIELFRKAADAGYAESQCSMGVCYATGNGVEQNDYEAVRWFTMAAEKGDQYAQKNLGIIYRNGRGVAVNPITAVQWFEKAAEQGNIQAKACLADMYANGEGIPANYSRAENLYKEVIDNGESDYYEDAIFNLALMYATKTNNNFAAFPLWKISAEHGNTTAKYNLGLCYHNGWGISKDDNQALYWWRQAAAEGDENARNNAQILEQELRGGNVYGGGYQAPAPKKSGGCYVATAVYGSYDCPEVWTLRRYRDYTLAETWYGRAFIKTYYAVSPTIVKWFGNTAWFSRMWKGPLDRMVKKLQEQGFENTPYDDKKF